LFFWAFRLELFNEGSRSDENNRLGAQTSQIQPSPANNKNPRRVRGRLLEIYIAIPRPPARSLTHCRIPFTSEETALRFAPTLSSTSAHFLIYFLRLFCTFSRFSCMVRLEIWTRLIIENNFYNCSHLSLFFLGFVYGLSNPDFKPQINQKYGIGFLHDLLGGCNIYVCIYALNKIMLYVFMHHFYIWFWLVRYSFFSFLNFLLFCLFALALMTAENYMFE
jgi:hypothetical protein